MCSESKLRILLFSDCMSYGCWQPKKSDVFYGAVMERLLNQRGIPAVVENTAGSGETTGDSLKRLERDVLTRDFDVLVYQYGINDALPRGLTRSDRGKIIRGMYKAGMNEKMRLWTRTYFLNPLEYLLLKIRGPRFYATRRDTAQNVEKIIRTITSYSKREVPFFIVSINPILNYRFGDTIPSIHMYNQVLMRLVKNFDHVFFIDTCSCFLQDDLRSLLDLDLFHLSEKGHMVMAEKISEVIAGVLKNKKDENEEVLWEMSSIRHFR